MVGTNVHCACFRTLPRLSLTTPPPSTPHPSTQPALRFLGRGGGGEEGSRKLCLLKPRGGGGGMLCALRCGSE